MLGQWLLGDVLHLPGGGFGLVIAGAGILWIGRGSSVKPFQPPESVRGWIRRCEEVLNQFDAFEAEPTEKAARRRLALRNVLDRSGPLRVGLVSVKGTSLPDLRVLGNALAGNNPITLSVAHPLVAENGQRCLPEGIRQQDVILHVLTAPLMAADLLWLQQLPEDQPAWMLVEGLTDDGERELLDQLQVAGAVADLSGWAQPCDAAQPFRAALRSIEICQDDTRKRLMADLHRGWQAELEHLRRRRFMALQQRTQWVVAASVLASPLPTVDLLAVAVANGLMMREMAEIWGCKLNPDVLKEAAAQLARAALAQGIVEWSSQMLLGLAKLDGGSWLAAGAMQALSAAYLTRVVGRSMADWLALNAGVAEPDLDALKRQAPLLVARAAEEERVNWSGFVQQSRQWLLHPIS